MITFYSAFPFYHCWLAHQHASDRRAVASKLRAELSQALDCLDWSLHEIEHPHLLARRQSPAVLGRKRVEKTIFSGFDDALATWITFRYYEYGIGVFALQAVLPENCIEAPEMPAAVAGWQQEVTEFHAGIDDRFFGSNGLLGVEKQSFERELRTAFERTGVELSVMPLASESGGSWGSTYADCVFLPDAINPDGCTAGWPKPLPLNFRGHSGPISALLDYNVCLFACSSERDAHMCREMIDLLTVSSVGLSDTAQEVSRSLRDLYAGEIRVTDEAVDKIKRLRRLSFSLRMDAIPYGVVWTEGEQSIYEAIYTVWRLNELNEIAADAVRAATEEIEAEYAERRSERDARMSQALYFISALAFIGLCAQIVDFIFSKTPPSMYARTIFLILVAIVTVGFSIAVVRPLLGDRSRALSGVTRAPSSRPASAASPRSRNR